MKSTFALWLASEWNLPTMYFSADMSGFQATTKLAAKLAQMKIPEVEREMAGGEKREWLLERLSASQISFSFASPIKFDTIYDELSAWIVLYNEFPKVIVFDNLMDMEDAESDYSAQMFAMQIISEISRMTGATCMVLHHASDKSWDAKDAPYKPPSRAEVKGGLSEKPELSLGVAFNNDEGVLDFNVAVIKQRMGPQDPTARSYVTLKVDPERNTFYSPHSTDYTGSAGISNGI